MSREGLLERAVKDAVAGGVDEVGEHHGIFFGELGGLVRAEIKARAN